MLNIIEIYPEINYDYTKHTRYNETIKREKADIVATCEERKDYDKSRELTTK